ncbi:MAG: hypothetical protein ACLFQ3_09795 [Thiohalorhabdus sp.]
MSEDRRIKIGFLSLAHAERELGINRSTIHEALNKPGRTAGGWYWTYYEEKPNG